MLLLRDHADAFEVLTGYSEEDTLGKNCRFLQGEDTEPVALLQLVEALRLPTRSSRRARPTRSTSRPLPRLCVRSLGRHSEARFRSRPAQASRKFCVMNHTHMCLFVLATMTRCVV